MVYLLSLVFISLFIGFIIFSINNQRKNVEKNKMNFSELDISRKLKSINFQLINENSIIGFIEDYKVGIFFLTENNDLKLYGLIDIKRKWNSTKEIMSFNKKFLNEGYVVDSKTGFSKKIDKNISYENLLIEFGKMIEVAISVDNKDHF